jgi:hypothetical protein
MRTVAVHDDLDLAPSHVGQFRNTAKQAKAQRFRAQLWNRQRICIHSKGAACVKNQNFWESA